MSENEQVIVLRASYDKEAGAWVGIGDVHDITANAIMKQAGIDHRF